MVITKKTQRSTARGLLAALALAVTWVATPEPAAAQEILVTGPLAGAPAVRKLRLRREGRFELAPTVSFTLLDEYQRQIFVGARLGYNFTDWLGLGVWGAVSPGPLKITTKLAEDIQAINVDRARNPMGQTLNRRLTAVNLNPQSDFADQLGTIDWIAAPQITLVPFRGKIAIFQSIYADTDLYLFGGPAFVGVTERADCAAGTCNTPTAFDTESRIAIAPTFGLGLSFYVAKWAGFGFEWRGIPFARNTGGFDNRGRDPDGEFPDLAIDGDDRQFKFNQMLTVSFSFYLPTMYHVSE